MGQRLTQRILECSLCGKIPENGEHIWEMGRELWCEECCDKIENEQENEQENELKNEK
jgi:hypothetical protein